MINELEKIELDTFISENIYNIYKNIADRYPGIWSFAFYEMDPDLEYSTANFSKYIKLCVEMYVNSEAYKINLKEQEEN